MLSESQPVSGLDRLVSAPDWVRAGGAGLLTHSAAVTAGLARGVDALVGAGVPIRCLISPEHGYWGTGQAGDGNDEVRDRVTGLPVLDTYGSDGARLDELLDSADIDHVIVDLQDIGCRFYTYMWSMVDVMASCARIGLPMTVLDRPSPLAAVPTGPGLDPQCASFVGRLGVALRHGMRIGAVARMVAADHLDDLVELEVIDAPGSDGDAIWVPPSPNMPTRDTVALYPGTGLLEGTTLCEGRGTTRPFQLFGAPWCGPELAAHLRELDLPGVAFREAVFRPTHGTFAGARVHGAEVHLTVDLETAGADTRTFDPLRVGHAILAAVATLYTDRPLWREQDAGRPFIDLLWGSPALREGIAQGASYEQVLAASPAPLPTPT